MNFSDTQDRATLVDIDSPDSMSPATKRQRKSSTNKQAKNKKKVTVTAGKVPLRVPGYSGIQSLSASALIPYIPLAKLKLAAKKVLKRAGVAKKIKKRKGKKQSKSQ